MADIRSRPSTDTYRANWDRIFGRARQAWRPMGSDEDIRRGSYAYWAQSPATSTQHPTGSRAEDHAEEATWGDDDSHPEAD